jgi:hypothetical protein
LFTLESRFRALLWVNAAGLALCVVLWNGDRDDRQRLALGGGPARGDDGNGGRHHARRDLRREVADPAAGDLHHGTGCGGSEPCVLRLAPVPRDAALLAEIATGFCIPPAAILRGRSQLRYRIRSARDYPDRR